MLRVPMLATYHTDFPAYIDRLAGDHRITNGAVAYLKWFYGQAAVVFSRSGAYRFNLLDLGVAEGKLRTIPPGVSLDTFSPIRCDDNLWDGHHITQPRWLLYCGRVSVEKNLPMLVGIFKALSRKRKDVALIVAGDGPYLEKMKQDLSGVPAHFLGVQDDSQLGSLYAGSDLFVFPSCTDTLGQAVIEAQACGLPAIVTNEGGPKETVEHNVTGLVLAGADPSAWCSAIAELLDDEPRRQRMSRAAIARAGRFSLARTFQSFWAEHRAGVEPPPRDQVRAVPHAPVRA